MKTILVLTDFSKRAEHAAELALEIARRARAEIILYNSYNIPTLVSAEPGGFPFYNEYPLLEQDNFLQLKQFSTRLKESFFRKHHTIPPPIHLKNGTGNLADNIHDIGKRRHIWMIVMGDKSSEKGISRFVLGSDSYAVIDKATSPVLIIPEGSSLRQIGKIAFATDLQQHERKAMPFLKDFAAIFGSELLFIHVCEEKVSAYEKVEHCNRYKAIARPDNDVDCRYVDVMGSDITDTLDRLTAQRVDILALQHKKRGFFEELFHESISKKMMNYHHVPLLIIPEV